MSSIILAQEYKKNDLKFGKFQVSKNSAGSGSVSLGYDYKSDGNSDNLTIQTAKMKAPFGIGNNEKFRENENSKLKWSLQLSFDGIEKNKKIDRFHKFLDMFDEQIKVEGLKNAETWINDDDADEKSMRKSYKPALKKFKAKKETPDKIYPDTFKINVPWNYEQDKPHDSVEIYDEKGELTEYTDIIPGCEIIAVFSVSSIWCARGLGFFGPSIRLVQLQVFKPKKIKGFNIKYDKDSDEESGDEAEAEGDDNVSEAEGDEEEESEEDEFETNE